MIVFFKESASTGLYTYGQLPARHAALPISPRKLRYAEPAVPVWSEVQRLRVNSVAAAAWSGASQIPIMLTSHSTSRLAYGESSGARSAIDRKSTRLNSSHYCASLMPSSD